MESERSPLKLKKKILHQQYLDWVIDDIQKSDILPFALSFNLLPTTLTFTFIVLFCSSSITKFLFLWTTKWLFYNFQCKNNKITYFVKNIILNIINIFNIIIYNKHLFLFFSFLTNTFEILVSISFIIYKLLRTIEQDANQLFIVFSHNLEFYVLISYPGCEIIQMQYVILSTTGMEILATYIYI